MAAIKVKGAVKSFQNTENGEFASQNGLWDICSYRGSCGGGFANSQEMLNNGTL